MARKSNVKRVEPRKANLKVVKDNEIKTTSYNDINLKKWKTHMIYLGNMALDIH